MGNLCAPGPHPAAMVRHRVAVDLAVIKDDLAAGDATSAAVFAGGIGKDAAVRQPHALCRIHAAAGCMGLEVGQVMHGSAMMDPGTDQVDRAGGVDAAARGEVAITRGNRMIAAVAIDSPEAKGSGTAMREHAIGLVAVDRQRQVVAADQFEIVLRALWSRHCAGCRVRCRCSW